MHHCQQNTATVPLVKSFMVRRFLLGSSSELNSSGAPFQWAAIFKKGDINFTRGHHDLVWYDTQEKSIEHKLPCKVSCAYCRTPIMDEGRNMILLFPTLVKFKDAAARKKFEPS